MDFKDYYAALGVARTATQDEIKRAYRKLARKFHPDVSKEPQAEARFKDVAEAHEALIDPERRAEYDAIVLRRERGQAYEPPPGWDRGGGREGAEFSDFFESLFSRGARRRPAAEPGSDSHATLAVDLLEAYGGARRTVTLRVPVRDALGRSVLEDRQLEVTIPAGVRSGQRLRLAGQGGPGRGGGPAGDLYLEIALRPHASFRVDGADVLVDLPVAPWEAALGASVTAATPTGEVHLSIPPGSTAGRKLRLKGRGLPGARPGDLYVVLQLVLPPAGTDAEQAAYAALAQAFPGWDPRAPTAARA